MKKRLLIFACFCFFSVARSGNNESTDTNSFSARFVIDLHLLKREQDESLNFVSYLERDNQIIALKRSFFTCENSIQLCEKYVQKILKGKRQMLSFTFQDFKLSRLLSDLKIKGKKSGSDYFFATVIFNKNCVFGKKGCYSFQQKNQFSPVNDNAHGRFTYSKITNKLEKFENQLWIMQYKITSYDPEILK